MAGGRLAPQADRPGQDGLSGRLVARADLTATQRMALFDLLSKHFAGVQSDTFRRDLDEKNWVLLLEDAGGAIVGFTTLLVYPSRATNEPALIVTSGDTIVDPGSWGSLALHKVWIESVYALHARHPGHALYWLLLTSGFRTYRFLSTFCKRFYPRFDAETPPAEAALMRALAHERWGKDFDPSTGLVRFAHPQCLREHLSPIRPGRRLDPHVAFFLARNPGHAQGDELVSFASMLPDNLTPAGLRMAGMAGLAG